MSELRIGVAGVGRLGAVHARILREINGVRLVGVYDSEPDRTTAVADQYQCKAFSTAEELWAASDAVVVAAPTGEHHAVAAAALEANCHVLVEKPLATSLVEADDLIARADAAGLFLAVGHVERFNPVIRACRHLMENPRFLTCIRLARFQPRGTDVAVTLDLMIHDIDLVLGLVDSPVISFEAIGISLITDTVDMANARLRFENGAIADVSASRASVRPTRELRVFQESGYFSLDLAAGRGEFHRRRLPPPKLEYPATASLADYVERIVIEGDGGEPLRAELEAFVGAINGLPSDIVTGRGGRAALEVALNISREIERSQHVITQHS
ncbi:MAG: Gfo/Idh/MocA family oxidoreductase [Gemmatimonadota bacterium]